MDEEISLVMNKNFVSFSYSTDSKVIREQFSSKIRFIPLVNDSGELVDIADPLGNYRISILEPHLQGNELNYVSDCIKTNWISSQGKYVSQFEDIFEDLHSGMHALAVSNGSVALQLALVAFGLEKGDEVIVPNITFAASANSVIHAGGVPVFCEIDPVTGGVWIRKKLKNSYLQELVPLCQCIYMDNHATSRNLKNYVTKISLLMIEDCAEALGSQWQGKKVGTFGDASTFSFFGNKTVSTGEGGMVYFGIKKFFIRQKFFRDHGMSKNKRYWHEVVGFNFRLTNVQAAIGVGQMERFEAIIEKKLSIFEIYQESLCGIPRIAMLPTKVEQTLHSNWLFGLVLEDDCDRDLIMKELLSYGVETRPFFYPLHNMNPYKNYKASASMKNSKRISLNGLSLPSSVNLSENEQSFITKTLVKVIEKQIS